MNMKFLPKTGLWTLALLTAARLPAAPETGITEFSTGEGEGVRADAKGLRLDWDPARFLTLHRAGPKYAKIPDMTTLGGKLYFGTCNVPMDESTGNDAEVLCYDPATDQVSLAFKVSDYGILRMHTYGDRLYMSGVEGGCGIYLYDGKKLTRTSAVSGSYHTLDVALVGKALYASFGALDGGRLSRSDDGGKTWKPVFQIPVENPAASPQAVSRIYFMGVLGDILLANPMGYEYDDYQTDLILVEPGKEPRKLDLEPGHLTVTNYAVFAGKLWMQAGLQGGGKPRQAHGCTFDGKDFQVCPDLHAALDLFATEDALYALLCTDNEDHTQGLVVSRTKDGQTWGKLATFSAKKDPHPHSHPEDMLTEISLAVLEGRIYVGCNQNATLYAEAYAGKGTWTSKPLRVSDPAQLQVSWKALPLPKAKGKAEAPVRYRIRSGPTSESLAEKPFSDAFDKPSDLSKAVGTDAWIQVQVLLTSVEEGRRSPVLTSLLVRGTAP